MKEYDDGGLFFGVQVVTGLQHLEAFAEYPLHMQYKLAQVAWYQE